MKGVKSDDGKEPNLLRPFSLPHSFLESALTMNFLEQEECDQVF